MHKKIIAICLALFTLQSHSETCPTPAELTDNHLNNWQAFDIDNGTSVPDKRLKQFEQDVDQFALAEWMQDAPEGEAHCYYYGKDPDRSYLGLFLAKHRLKPNTKVSSWHPVGADTQQCSVNLTDCGFIPD